MNCDDCQNWICESLDIGGDILANADVAEHLAACTSCREFHDTSVDLDFRLTRHAGSATVPADFKSTLLNALPTPRPKWTPEEIAARRVELEREYHAAIAALNRQYLIPQALKTLRLLGVAAGFVLAGIVLAEMIRSAPVAIEVVTRQLAFASLVQSLGWVIGIIAMLYGLRRTWASPFRSLRWWRWVESRLGIE